MSTIYRVSPEERVEGQFTQGISREQAVKTHAMWSGFARTEPGMVSGWHHHGGYETTIYVLSGSLRMEFGSGGGARLWTRADVLRAGDSGDEQRSDREEQRHPCSGGDRHRVLRHEKGSGRKRRTRLG